METYSFAAENKSSNNSNSESSKNMISVEEAQSLIDLNCFSLELIEIPLAGAAGSVLTEDVYSPINLPPFDQSAMDGYAIRYSDHKNGLHISLIGEIPAGKAWSTELASGQALRIFTGAQIPFGADLVVELERVTLQGTQLFFDQADFKIGTHIRKEGSQISKGELALSKDEVVSPAAIGFLASMGIASVLVYRKPEIAIVVSGNELQSAGDTLNAGNIFESNSVMLRAAIEQVGFKVTFIEFVKDNKEDVEKIFNKFSGKIDVLIFTGGISVGDYDLIRDKLESSDVQKLFYKVRQKPGKPFWFGLSGKTRIFALPGNPAAVLSCFYLFLLPGLRKLSGFSHIKLTSSMIPILQSYEKKIGLAHFLKGKSSDTGVSVLDGQESYKLNSFADADCIVYIPEGITSVNKNELVKVFYLPKYL